MGHLFPLKDTEISTKLRKRSVTETGSSHDSIGLLKPASNAHHELLVSLQFLGFHKLTCTYLLIVMEMTENSF